MKLLVNHGLAAFNPKVQLDSSWTLEMSIRQNDWFAEPSDSLSSSLSFT